MPARLNYLDVQRVLAQYAEVIGATFYMEPAYENEEVISVWPEQALNNSLFSPFIGIEAYRLWDEAYGPRRSISLGAIFMPNDESTIGLGCEFPLIGPDVVSRLRLLTFLHAANRVLEWETNPDVEVSNTLVRLLEQNILVRSDHVFVIKEGVADLHIPLRSSSATPEQNR